MSKSFSPTIIKSAYKPLDINKLKDKEHVEISTEEALKDVTPVDRDKEVLTGSKHVVLVGKN